LFFLNKYEDTEKPVVAEYYQRCFDCDVDESAAQALR